VEPGWSQVIDVEVIKTVTEWALPGLCCPGCGTVTFAEPPPGAYAGSVSYGPVLNAAAVLLTAFGNVPPERAAQLMGMLLGTQVSAGWADKAGSRLSARLGKAGFDEAMLAALAGEKTLAADETPVNVPGEDTPRPPAPEDAQEEERDPEGEKDGKAGAGAPHVLIVRTPDGRLTLLQAIASRRKGRGRRRDPRRVHRIADHRRLHRLPAPPCQAGRHPAMLPARHPPLPRCAETRPRRRAVLGRRHHHHRAPGAPGRGGRPRRGDTALDPRVLDDLRERYDQAVRTGIIFNRLRDWHEGNHPGYALAAWLAGYKEQVLLFTRDFAVDWTSNSAERGAKAAKRPSLVTGTNADFVIRASMPRL
jgi:transposase